MSASPSPPSRPDWLVADLRSGRAGETGAVAICRGILACCRAPAIREFAERHLETERGHLRRIEAVLPAGERSRLLPAWRVAGFLVGALPELAGPWAVYATIAAVERFVDRHYQAYRRDEARDRHGGLLGAALRAWGEAVEGGAARRR